MPAPTTAEATTSSQPTAGNGLERLYTTDLASEIEFLTARARSLGSGRANNMLAELDLKVRSYSVLSLACSGQNPSQRELADFLSLDPSQIVALVDQLEKRGAVTREADPRDRRSKVIAPTPAGRNGSCHPVGQVSQLRSLSCLMLSSAASFVARSPTMRV